MPKNTRARQLARQHQRRQAERLQHQRKRQTITIVVALAIALVGGSVAFAAFNAGDDSTTAASGETATTAPTGATGETGSTGKTSTVEPSPGPEAVACGAEQPKDAPKPKPQFAQPKQVLKQGKTYTAEMQTSCGTITIELLADQAP